MRKIILASKIVWRNDFVESLRWWLHYPNDGVHNVTPWCLRIFCNVALGRCGMLGNAVNQFRIGGGGKRRRRLQTGGIFPNRRL